jgi:hypothetical protein
MKTIRRHCGTCGQPRPFTKDGVNHILHVILSLLTVGGWLLVWILLIIVNALQPYRCTQCGQAKTF